MYDRLTQGLSLPAQRLQSPSKDDFIFVVGINLLKILNPSFAYTWCLTAILPLLTKPERQMNPVEQIRAYNQEQALKIIILDDTPNGCQSVYGVPILLSWENDLLARALVEHDVIIILTNSRAVCPLETVAIHKTILERLQQLIEPTRLRIISRGGSTLRGHFWEEISTIQSYFKYDGIIVAPFFEEAGHITKHGTHYIMQDGHLQKMHRSAFAQDPIFGYNHSFLPLWIEEKTKQYWLSKQVRRLDLDQIRRADTMQLADELMLFHDGQPIVVDSETDDDLGKVTLAICLAESRGKRFLYRAASSFVRWRTGIPKRTFLEPQTLSGGSLIIVGSHVEKSTQQLQYLLRQGKWVKIELNSSLLFSKKAIDYQNKIVKKINTAIQLGQHVVLYSERNYQIADDTLEQRLKKAQHISSYICDIVRKLTIVPALVIAKGGITSLEIARKGLGAKQAQVLGQVTSGVTLWQMGQDIKFPAIPYVVFPGNVGNGETLFQVFTLFHQQ